MNALMKVVSVLKQKQVAWTVVLCVGLVFQADATSLASTTAAISFTNQTLISVDKGTQNGQTVGWSFTVNTTKSLDYLGLYNAGLTSATKVELWDTNGLVPGAVATFNSSDLTGVDQSDLANSNFLWYQLSSSVLLQPGVQYTLGAFCATTCQAAVNLNASSGGPVLATGLNVTTYSQIFYGDEGRPNDATFAEIFSTGYLGPNMRLASPVPVPAAIWLLGSGLLGLGGLTRRKNTPSIH